MKFQPVIVLITLASVSLFWSSCNAGRLTDKSGCGDKRLEEMDRKGVKIDVFGKGGRFYPNNNDELKPFCDETSSLLNSMERFFKECYTNDIQNVVKIFVYSIKRSMKSLCSKKKNKKVQKLLKYTPCMNSYVPKDQCVAKMRNDMQGLIPYQIPQVEKVYRSCCYYVQMLKCMEQALSRLPCMSEEARDDFLMYVRNLTGDGINFACGEYNDQTDRCDTLKPLNQFKKDPKLIDAKKFRSTFFVNIAMLETALNETSLP